jgi:hypothetical protein
MDSSFKRTLVLFFVVILGLLSFSGSVGGDGSHPQGKGDTTVTFYVA